MDRLRKFLFIFLAITVLGMVSLNSSGSINDPMFLVENEEIDNKSGDENKDDNKKDVVKSDSTLLKGESINKSIVPSAEKKPKIEKKSESALSYNFMFYLMYKFKIDEIFNLSKRKSKVSVPTESVIYERGKYLVNHMLNEIGY